MTRLVFDLLRPYRGRLAIVFGAMLQHIVTACLIATPAWRSWVWPVCSAFMAGMDCELAEIPGQIAQRHVHQPPDHP
jgi:hypothetical protein